MSFKLKGGRFKRKPKHGLYDNIPPKEGVQSVEEGLRENPNIKIPSGFITRLMEIILEYSVFEFDEKLYQQQFGTSMGSKPAPSYANSFMARKIDLNITRIAQKYQENSVLSMTSMKRFLDDIFMIFLGTIENLHKFFEEINLIHANIKFTMSHTTPDHELQQPPSCTCPIISSIPYLDTSC
jgi:hypothetical protein